MASDDYVPYDCRQLKQKTRSNWPADNFLDEEYTEKY